MFMSKKALCEFYEEQMEDAYETGVMFSLHVKATMMKVIAPHRLRPCREDLLQGRLRQAPELFDELGVNVNNGLSELYRRSSRCPRPTRRDHRGSAPLSRTPTGAGDGGLGQGITNFHSPNDVIVDASMPAMIRQGGKMYGADGRTKDTKAVNPESTFSRIYQEVINFCKTNGQFDPATMGTVPNVGLMAQQAEEYGSHDKTFEISHDGVANIVDLATGEVLLTQNVEAGDIWRLSSSRMHRSGLGQVGCHPGAQLRYAGGVLAGRRTPARERGTEEGQYLSLITTPRVWTSRSCRRCALCGTRSSG